MKKTLYIIEGLGIGGAEKSLLTKLNNIDYTECEVDLLLFDHSRVLMQWIPKQVHLIPEDQNYKIFYSNRKLAPWNFLKKGKMKLAALSVIYLLKCIVYRINHNKLYTGWDIQKHFFAPIEKKYDTSIAYLERKCIYYNIDKVESEEKIGFVHNDYSKYQYDYKQDKKYFEHYGQIATVSEHSKEVLIDIFPEYRDKFIIIQNEISPQLIREMADEEIDLVKEKGELVIVTVGRVVEQKGYHVAIEICRGLVGQGYKIKWYVIGPYYAKEQYYKKLLDKIKEYDLTDRFIFLGSRLNPYKYMKFCDVYVQPSIYEGYGITIAEVKVLGKYIVAADIPEFREQLSGENNGQVCRSIIDYVNAIEIINNLKIVE